MPSFKIDYFTPDRLVTFTVSWRDFVLTVRINRYLLFALSGLLSWSMLAAILGITVASALTVSALIHECGHAVIASRVGGLKDVDVQFIPLLGACTIFRGLLKSHRTYAVMIISGPVAGLLSGWLSLTLYPLTGSELFLTYAIWTALLTFVNLIPFVPLDGGHLKKSMLATSETSRSVQPMVGREKAALLAAYALSLALTVLLGVCALDTDDILFSFADTVFPS